jgi:pyoverdine/dityrosine biosynthesis protein Dit1
VTFDLETLIEAREAERSDSDSADPVDIAANGNGTKQQEINMIDGFITPRISKKVSKNKKMAMEVLKIIESYGVDFEKTGVSWKGFESFVPIVLGQIDRNEPIRMILPAFPFKSPNSRDKVLGTMPDFGEELALAHLNGLCQNIAEVYTPGANVYISSDGLVYNG